MLRPDGPAERRNPPGALDQQAVRLLNLLNGEKGTGLSE
jgi:hypothetical protein